MADADRNAPDAAAAGITTGPLETNVNRVIGAPPWSPPQWASSSTSNAAAMDAGSLFGFRLNIQFSPKSNYGMIAHRSAHDPANRQCVRRLTRDQGNEVGDQGDDAERGEARRGPRIAP